MGCLGCFGRRKNRRRQKRRESFQPRIHRISEGSIKNVKEVPKVSEESHLNLKVPIIEEVPNFTEENVKVLTVEKVSNFTEENVKVLTVEEPVIPVSEICDKAEEKCSPSPNRKRVTFDSKVKTYEHIVVEESIELFEEKKEEVKRCSLDGSDVTSNSSGSYPSNHRYQNCRESDDEEEEDVTDCEESDIDDDDDGLLREDYYDVDDNYEVKLEKWDNQVYTEEIADNVVDIERIEEKSRGLSYTSARDRSGYVNAVLNPIENLSQWKAVKSNGRTIQPQSKKEKTTNACLEPRVDASLSSWLSTSGRNNVSISVETTVSETKIHTVSYSKPVQSHDERPILRALSSEEVQEFSAKNSPRKSPSRSPESPIIGTVGGYWNSRSMATSRYRDV